MQVDHNDLALCLEETFEHVIEHTSNSVAIFSCHLYILSTEKGESNSLEVHYNSECFNVYVISAHSVMMNVCITEHWSSYMYSYTRRLSIYPECGRILSFGGLVMRDDGEGRLRS